MELMLITVLYESVRMNLFVSRFKTPASSLILIVGRVLIDAICSKIVIDYRGSKKVKEF